MQVLHALPDVSLTAAAAIGWFYLITNAARIFTYVPQIVAVWRSTDGRVRSRCSPGVRGWFRTPLRSPTAYWSCTTCSSC